MRVEQRDELSDLIPVVDSLVEVGKAGERIARESLKGFLGVFVCFCLVGFFFLFFW